MTTIRTTGTNIMVTHRPTGLSVQQGTSYLLLSHIEALRLADVLRQMTADELAPTATPAKARMLTFGAGMPD